MNVEDKNTCVTVNWIHVALKVTARYVPAADCVIYINNQTKDKFKITLCSWLKDFCSFNKKHRKFNSYNFSSSLLTE